ncbi:hypothetical protein XENOCAPTIV_025169 [Xenoophorus captivus]|uniref:Uncharacterized protein n=1 Tax=Xenoophorus captivus TaxID=1517983 RepID=A0ABV0QBH1_9TELE
MLPASLHSGFVHCSSCNTLDHLRDLQKAMGNDHITATNSWFDWMIQGGWMRWIKLFFVAIVAWLIILCALSVCIVPCCKCMINRIVSQSITVAYAALNQSETQQDPDKDDYHDADKDYFTDLEQQSPELYNTMV